MYWLSISEQSYQRFWNCMSHLNVLDVVVHEVFGEYDWCFEKPNPDSVSLHSIINHFILVLNKRNVIFLYRSSPFSYHLWGLWRFSSYSSSEFCNNLQVKITNSIIIVLVFLISLASIIINSYSSRTRRIWADVYNQRGCRLSWLLSAHIRQVREE